MLGFDTLFEMPTAFSSSPVRSTVSIRRLLPTITADSPRVAQSENGRLTAAPGKNQIFQHGVRIVGNLVSDTLSYKQAK